MSIRNRVAFAVSGMAAVAVTAGVAVSSSAASGNWATATSATAGGGMSALVAAATQEGKIKKAFTKKNGIKINDAIPDGSSAQEIEAIEHDKGRTDAPDVLDIGQSF